MNLCKSCADKYYRSKPGICCICGETTSIHARGMCGKCYGAEQRKKRKENQKIVVCSKCGRLKPLYYKKMNLCHTCYTNHLKNERGYETPKDKCAVCGQFTNIFGHGMCRSCYNKWYAKENHDKIELKRRQRFRNNPDKKRKYARMFVEKKRHIYGDERVNDENMIGCVPRNVLSNEEIIASFPEMKRGWVEEFLSTVYNDREDSTIRKFLKDMQRLVTFLHDSVPQHYDGGWNLLDITDIERCQVETGVLKDSLKMFFKWLETRKRINNKISSAFVPDRHGWRISNLNVDKLSVNVKMFFDINKELPFKIAGQLIVYYLVSCDEMRLLTIDCFHEHKIFIHGEWRKVPDDLWSLIEEYMVWRKDYYFEYAPEYFFVTGKSVSEKTTVGVNYFWRLFKRNRCDFVPSELRKMMISFYKSEVGMDFFELSAISGITPEATIPY